MQDLPTGLPMPRRLAVAAVGAIAAVPRAPRARAADADAVTVARDVPPRAAPAATFTGDARVLSPFQARPPARASGGIVEFAPGARTAWHIHPLGQTLLVLNGAGLVQRWGELAQGIEPGDVVWIPPGVKHWHGAGPRGPMSHVAVGEMLDGKTVEWAEHVSAEQYARATSGTAP